MNNKQVNFKKGLNIRLFKFKTFFSPRLCLRLLFKDARQKVNL